MRRYPRFYDAADSIPWRSSVNHPEKHIDHLQHVRNLCCKSRPRTYTYSISFSRTLWARKVAHSKISWKQKNAAGYWPAAESSKQMKKDPEVSCVLGVFVIHAPWHRFAYMPMSPYAASICSVRVKDIPSATRQVWAMGSDPITSCPRRCRRSNTPMCYAGLCTCKFHSPSRIDYWILFSILFCHWATFPLRSCYTRLTALQDKSRCLVFPEVVWLPSQDSLGYSSTGGVYCRDHKAETFLWQFAIHCEWSLRRSPLHEQGLPCSKASTIWLSS